MATKTIESIQPFESLGSMRTKERADIDSAMQVGAILAVSGFDPKRWEHVRFCLWKDAVPPTTVSTTIYSVLHVSAPKGTVPFLR